MICGFESGQTAMLIVVSPAKTLDFESRLPSSRFSQPQSLNESQALIEILRDYSADDLSHLMNVSENIASLNVERYAKWSQPFTDKNARPAVFAFKGDVYDGLQAYQFKVRDVNFAQKHLRILSGLYGVLRPLDLIQAYRLEMGIKLKTPSGKDLYQFWGDRITDLLNTELRERKKKVLINLASNEYFKSVNTKTLDADIIHPKFYDWKNGQYKMIGFFAKKARGMMSRYIITERLTGPERIKNFCSEGYSYNPELSSAKEWIFTRKHASL